MSMSDKYLPFHNFLNRFNFAEGLAPLLLRLYLAPVLIQAGWNKYSAFSDSVAWFGNPDWGLGLPMPEVMVTLAIAAELLGGGISLNWPGDAMGICAIDGNYDCGNLQCSLG